MIVASREQVRRTHPVSYIRVGHDKPSLALIQGLFAHSAQKLSRGGNRDDLGLIFSSPTTPPAAMSRVESGFSYVSKCTQVSTLVGKFSGKPLGFRSCNRRADRPKELGWAGQLYVYGEPCGRARKPRRIEQRHTSRCSTDSTWQGAWFTARAWPPGVCVTQG